jgi:hypothetical protein
LVLSLPFPKSTWKAETSVSPCVVTKSAPADEPDDDDDLPQPVRIPNPMTASKTAHHRNLVSILSPCFPQRSDDGIGFAVRVRLWMTPFVYQEWKRRNLRQLSTAGGEAD